METVTNSFDLIGDKLSAWLTAAIKLLPNFVVAVLVLTIFWQLSVWIHRLVLRVFKRTELQGNLEQLMAQTVKLGVLLVGLVLALGVMQLDKAVYSLLAGVGVIGLALGFAFQDLVGNFVAGLMIAIRSPFRIGDMIEAGKVTGNVQEIRLRDTVVRNFTGQHIVVPNKTFMTNEVTNYSISGKRRMEFFVGIAYDSSLRDAVSIIKNAVEGVEGIQSSLVQVDSLDESSVSVLVQFWVTFPGTDIGACKAEAIIRIKDALDQANIGIPFPTRTLDLSDDLTRMLAALPQSSRLSEQQKGAPKAPLQN